jgi:hypothetical protein
MHHMKAARNTFRVISFAFGIVAVVMVLMNFWSCVSSPTQTKTGTVTFEPYGIVMHPGTKISKSDEVKLNEILRKYDDRLYRIETYQNGKLVKKEGRLKEKELPDIYITQEIVSEVANAKVAGLSVSTMCLSTSDKKAPLRQLQREQGKKLVQELSPVLQKYTKQ